MLRTALVFFFLLGPVVAEREAAALVYLEASLAFKAGDLAACRQVIESSPESYWKHHGLVWKTESAPESYLPVPEGVVLCETLSRRKAAQAREQSLRSLGKSDVISQLSFYDVTAGKPKWSVLCAPSPQLFFHPGEPWIYVVGESIFVLSRETGELIRKVPREGDQKDRAIEVLVDGSVAMRAGAPNEALLPDDYLVLDAGSGQLRKISYPTDLLSLDPLFRFIRPAFEFHPTFPGAYGVRLQEKALFSVPMRQRLNPSAAGSLMRLESGHLFAAGAEQGRELFFTEIDPSLKHVSERPAMSPGGLLQDTERSLRTGGWSPLGPWKGKSFWVYEQSGMFRVLSADGAEKSPRFGQPWWFEGGLRPNRQAHRVGNILVLSGVSGLRAYDCSVLSGASPARFRLAALYSECMRRLGDRRFEKRGMELVRHFHDRPEGWHLLFRDARRRKNPAGMAAALVGIIEATERLQEKTAFPMMSEKEARTSLEKMGVELLGRSQAEITQAPRQIDGKLLLCDTTNQVFELGASLLKRGQVPSQHSTWSEDCFIEMEKVNLISKPAMETGALRAEVATMEEWRDGVRPLGQVIWDGEKALRALPNGDLRVWDSENFSDLKSEHRTGDDWLIRIDGVPIGYDSQAVWALNEQRLPAKKVFSIEEGEFIECAALSDEYLVIITNGGELRLYSSSDGQLIRAESFDDSLNAARTDPGRLQIVNGGALFSAERVRWIPADKQESVFEFDLGFDGRAPARDVRGFFFSKPVVTDDGIIVTSQPGQVFRLRPWNRRK